MAPPEHPFPVGELENRIHTHTVNLKEKNRKLGPNFNLKDCELYELVQYSCTTPLQQQENIRKGGGAPARMECFPFVRLFRRCGEGGKTFHVETTAWEGQHAWQGTTSKQVEETVQSSAESFATHMGFFWSKK